MTKKESEQIAWALLAIIEAAESAGGLDSSVDTANAGIRAVEEIKRISPKIADQIKRLHITQPLTSTIHSP